MFWYVAVITIISVALNCIFGFDLWVIEKIEELGYNNQHKKDHKNKSTKGKE
jgi:hypothetical protein